MKKFFKEGIFIEKNKRYKGAIIMNDYKIYIKGNSPYVDTYIPLEKIVLIRRAKKKVFVQVKPTSISRRDIIITGSKEAISSLINEVVKKLNLKKKFFRSVWTGDAIFK